MVRFGGVEMGNPSTDEQIIPGGGGEKTVQFFFYTTTSGDDPRKWRAIKTKIMEVAVTNCLPKPKNLIYRLIRALNFLIELEKFIEITANNPMEQVSNGKRLKEVLR